MTRRPSLHGRIAVLILMGFGASFVGIAAPRSAVVIPSGNTSGVAHETDRRQTGAPEGLVSGAAPELESSLAVDGNEPDDGRADDPPAGAPSSAVASSRVTARATARPRTVTILRGPYIRSAAQVARKAPQPTQTSTESPRPAQSGSAAAALERGLSGLASWYCLAGRSACTRGYGPGCLCAAAGPLVRSALGDWRGQWVTVSTDRASVRVQLVDWCSCPNGRLLDLYAYPFSGLAALSAGLVDVTVR